MVLNNPGRFAAIEVKPGETPHQAIGFLMRLAHSQALLFVSLEVFETFKIHKTAFVRFRSDLDISKLKADLLRGERGLILRRQGEVRFEVALPTATGNYSASSMHATSKPTDRRKYRGTQDKFWERQFAG